MYSVSEVTRRRTDMKIMGKIWENARKLKRVIALPEGSEPRTLKAAEKIKSEKLADIILIGNPDIINNSAKDVGANIEGIKIIEPKSSEKFLEYANDFFELRKNKGMTLEQAKETLKNEIYFATMMVKKGDAYGMVSGAVHSTGDLLRPALQIIKTAPGISIVSSSFIMETPATEFGENGVLVFADCAINPNPNAEELASIALATASTAKSLGGFDPRVAMLSFSTKGSGKGEQVDKVVEATKIAKEKAPHLMIDGELQLDAAIVKKVADLKAPESEVAGKANVLIFPDLQSGNIGYKLIQRIAKANAIGPISQGFARPINDLSRGCSVDDIINVVAITAVQ
jgi:phosphate acetyltransferase